MNKMFGITGIKVKAFSEVNDVNHFLAIHDGNIIDIQMVTTAYGGYKYIVIYRKETED